MELRRRLRVDLARPEVPTGRDELGFLVGTALVILVVSQIVDPGDAVDLLLVAPAVLAFVLRGLVPRLPAEVFALLVIVPVTVAVSRDGALEGTFFLVVMMTFSATSQLESLTRAAIVTLAAASVALIVAEVLAPDSGILWEPWAMANMFVFALGRTHVRQRHLIDQLERARQALADQAVAEERRRIARELHDLAGHTLAAVLLHVTGARHVLHRGDVDEAERALTDAETVGRASLDQIRATVASLRTEERGTDPSLAGVADLPALVEDYRRAGLSIDSSIDARAVRAQRTDRHGGSPRRPGGSRQRRPPRPRQPRHPLGRCRGRRRAPRRRRPRQGGDTAGSRLGAVRSRRHGRAGAGARRSVRGRPH